MVLYPLIFKSNFYYRIWGRGELLKKLNKDYIEEKIGESWEISTLPNYESIIVNGVYNQLTINQLIKYFGSYFLGEKVYSKFGDKFPLLVKFIATYNKLSVQVHPDDNYAKLNHNSFGKNEMWYILDVNSDSNLILGFNKNTNKDEFLNKCYQNNLESLLNFFYPKKEEVYMVPAGVIHSIGKNILIVEIQQSSDITYRIYDYNRIDENGKLRSLHIKEAIKIMNFNKLDALNIIYLKKNNELIDLIRCPFFIVQKLKFNLKMTLQFSCNSFTILIVISGKLTVQIKNNQITIEKGKTILLPALLNYFNLLPLSKYVDVLIVRMFD